ncbi:unnamed protein product, partial [Staurois parvus]
MPTDSAHQCHISATFHCLPVHINANINAHLSCLSVSPISDSQCRLTVLRQCSLSVGIS